MIDDFSQLIAVTGLLVRYCVQRASVLPNSPLSSMMKGSFVVAPRVLATGAPVNYNSPQASGEATRLAKLLRIAGLYTVLDCLRHFAVP